jgi:hypothetical protein
VNEARLETATDRTERLRQRNKELSTELDHSRAEQERLLDALEKVNRPSKHRIRRFFVLSAAAGTAYVVGAKAGRERYEQIRRWFDDMRGRPSFQAWQDQARETASRASEGIQDMGTRAASTIQDKGSQAARKMDEASGSAADKVQQGASSAASKTESTSQTVSSGSSSPSSPSTPSRPNGTSTGSTS